MGPAFFFAGLVTLMYVWIKELLGRAAGLLAAALALILMPNLFGYAHIAMINHRRLLMVFDARPRFWERFVLLQRTLRSAIVWGLLELSFPPYLLHFYYPLGHIYHRQRYSNNVFVLLFGASVRYGRESALFVAPLAVKFGISLTKASAERIGLMPTS